MATGEPLKLPPSDDGPIQTPLDFQ